METTKDYPTVIFGKPYIWVFNKTKGQWSLFKYEVDPDEEKGYLKR